MEILAEVVSLVRQEVGPVAIFKQVGIVTRLPKTRPGKILRSTMRKMADGATVSVPSTIEDPAVLEEIQVALRQLGFGARAEDS